MKDMKKIALMLAIVFLSAGYGYSQLSSQLFSGCENVSAFNKNSTPDIGIVISSGDDETVWNALRLGVAAQSKGDSVVIFVISKAVDVFMKDSSAYDIEATSEKFWANGGIILTCATCAKMRHTEEVQMCTITSVFDLYEIIKRSKKIVSF
jgi:peroxiredoxin family protein